MNINECKKKLKKIHGFNWEGGGREGVAIAWGVKTQGGWEAYFSDWAITAPFRKDIGCHGFGGGGGGWCLCANQVETEEYLLFVFPDQMFSSGSSCLDTTKPENRLHYIRHALNVINMGILQGCARNSSCLLGQSVDAMMMRVTRHTQKILYIYMKSASCLFP